MYDFARYLNIRSATTPQLSPDGDRVAYLSDITGNFQVWSVGVSGPWQQRLPVQLTYFPDKVWEVYGTSAADHLIAVSDTAGNERQQFFLVSNYGSGPDGAGDEAVGGHTVRLLTQHPEAIHTFGAWSEDGQHILYTSNRRNNVDFDMYRMAIASGESTLLRECEGRRTVGAWFAGERYVLSVDSVATEQNELYLLDLESGKEYHLTANEPHARYGQICARGETVYLISDRTHDRGALCVMNFSEGADRGELRELLPAGGFDEMLAPGLGELELLAVSPDGERAALTVNAEGYSHLYFIELENLAIHPVADIPPGVISRLQFDRDGSSLVFDLQTPQMPPDIWLVKWQVDGESLDLERLTYSDRAGIDSRTFVAPELIHFATFDERQIPAFYYRPQSPPPGNRTDVGGYPCILYVHGGPAGQQRPDFDVRFQYFLSQGYALLVTNVRGSTGYGREYMMLDDLERRMDSVADLKYAVQWLQHNDEIAGDRIAIYGRSYGGFMVLAALTEYPELFAAGIDVVGIADWVTFLERTSPWRRAHREREYGSLRNHRDLLERISPIHKAERIQAPLLVLAGDNDPRVPLFESEQIVERVRAANGTVKFIHYADEGHKFSKLHNRIDSFTQMADFLREYIGS